jgi:predicted nucleic acid-binding protein
MTVRYLLDKNVLSKLIRDLQEAPVDRLRAVGEANVFTRVVVAFGAEVGFEPPAEIIDRYQLRAGTPLYYSWRVAAG